MKKIIVTAFVVVAAIGGYAKENVTSNGVKMIKVGNKMISAAKLRDTIRKVQLKKTGGMIREEGSAKGSFIILNAQKSISSSTFKPVIDTIDKWFLMQSSVKDASKGEINISNIKGKIKSSGGVVGVGIFDDPGLPGFLAAPEEGWAIVNVSALGRDKPNQEVLNARLRKETLRAFAFVTGGAYQAKACSLMRDVKSLADIDAIQERFGLDTIAHIRSSAPFYGLVPWYQTTYVKACEEGWAPAPTNDIQKAIWERVKADKERGPTNPIKIPPPKRK